MTWHALKALDFLLWALRGRRVYLCDDATCERMPKGHGVELNSHFPGWCWRFAVWMRNRVEVWPLVLLKFGPLFTFRYLRDAGRLN